MGGGGWYHPREYDNKHFCVQWKRMTKKSQMAYALYCCCDKYYICCEEIDKHFSLIQWNSRNAEFISRLGSKECTRSDVFVSGSGALCKEVRQPPGRSTLLSKPNTVTWLYLLRSTCRRQVFTCDVGIQAARGDQRFSGFAQVKTTSSRDMFTFSRSFFRDIRSWGRK